MKLLLLLFLFGFAAAIFLEDLDRARDEAISSFIEGMEKAPSLREAMNLPYAELDEIEEETKTGLVKVLKDAFQDLVQKVKDIGGNVTGDMVEHLRKIKDELNKLHEDISDKAKGMLERLKEKAKDQLRKLLEEWGFKKREEREVEEPKKLVQKLVEILKSLKEKISEKGADLMKIADEMKEDLKDRAIWMHILLKDLRKGSIEKVKESIDKMLSLLGKKDTRAIKDLYENIKDYLKEVREDFEQHFSAFLDWLDKVYKSGAEAAKDRIENVKKIAQKFIDHVKEVGKKTADQALEFFRPYKKDMGILWDELKKSIRETYGEH